MFFTKKLIILFLFGLIISIYFFVPKREGEQSGFQYIQIHHAFAQTIPLTPRLFCLGSCPTSPVSTVSVVSPQTSPTDNVTTASSGTPTSTPTQNPCNTVGQSAATHTLKIHTHTNGAISNFIQLLLQLLQFLINLISQLLGGGTLPPSGPTPMPSSTPITTVSPASGSPSKQPNPCVTPTVTQNPSTLPIQTINPTKTQTPTVTTSPTGTAKGSTYPWHTNIVSTTFWVGEIFNANLADGSQVCSAYDSTWAFHWSGINNGTIPANAAGCAGSIVGGCDGVPGANNACATEARTSTNGYFPTKVTPKENPFYLDLPFDDVNDSTAFNQRCTVIPWTNNPGFAGNCTNQNFSYMKNRWVRIVGPNRNTCYGQIEDAGPSHDNLYHDANYVFGSNDAQPVQGQFNNAGMDVSPALNGCLGFAELDGENDKVKWQFVDNVDVPVGFWTKIITTTPYTP